MHLPFCFRYIDLLLCGVWHLCDLPCGVYVFFSLISIAKCVLRSLSVGFQFEGQSLKYSLSMFQRKDDNWKPQAGDHVTGLCRRSISGRNAVLLSLPTGVLSLPLAELFLFFRTLFFAAPWLTERLEEAKRSPKISLGPCRQLSTPFIKLSTSLKRGFDSLKKTIYHQRLQYHNAMLAYNLWTKGMLLRCLRITENNKLMSMRQIRMTKNQILKNIQSLSTERVLKIH